MTTTAPSPALDKRAFDALDRIDILTHRELLPILAVLQKAQGRDGLVPSETYWEGVDLLLDQAAKAVQEVYRHAERLYAVARHEPGGGDQ